MLWQDQLRQDIPVDNRRIAATRNPHFRQTKVVFTIGPATESVEVLEQLIHQGVDICRINMAHANHQWTRDIARRVRAVAARLGREVALMMDVKGPEIRTGKIEGEWKLTPGEVFDFYCDPEREAELAEEGVRGVSINYPNFWEDVKVGNTMLVDSGLLRLEILEIKPCRVRTKVIVGGPLTSKRHVNLPGVKVRLPCLTEKDREDIKVALDLDIDLYALSFVREPDDLDMMRAFCKDQGQSDIRIIAKIEDQSAIENLTDIVKASDGIMVARGDLGIEIPYETLPVVQDRAIKECLKQGKSVIVATHMLESMIQNPMPTRAEITDVAHAVTQQADCVMLSGETSVGKFPLECVDTLNRIITEVEKQEGPGWNDRLDLKSEKGLLLRSAAILCQELQGAAIVCFTRSGYLANFLSCLRPRHSPIFAFTDDVRAVKRMCLHWGVDPFFIQFTEDPEETILKALNRLKETGRAQPGTRLVVIANALLGDRVIETIQLRTVE